MPSVLVAYATRYGSTREVADAIAATLRDAGFAADCRPAKEVSALQGYDAVVVGAPLLMFRWHKDAHRFLLRNRAALGVLRVALFALGPTHDPRDEQEWRDSRAQLDKQLARHEWLKPVAVEMFGGQFDPAKLHRMIRWMAGKIPATDIRDWAAIRRWAESLGDLFGENRETGQSD